MRSLSKIAVIGAGSWGTSLAMVAASSGVEVVLWTPIKEQAEELASTRRNKLLSESTPDLESNIVPTDDFFKVLGAELMLIVVPSIAMRSVAERMKEAGVAKEAVIVSCTKGIEQGSHMRMTEILSQALPANAVGCLSGPNHAEDICLGLPSCTLVGFHDARYAAWVQGILSTPHFRVYTSRDVAGMEMGGTIKNVFAIAAGMCAGLQLGDNAVAALVTRGLAEMHRIGVEYGGRTETFMGLSGVGDLMVTCYSRHSRNRTVGVELAKGRKLQEILDSVGMVAEGVPNTLSVYEMARRANVRTPLINAVYSILYEDKSPIEELRALMSGDPRPEYD